jgi:hypothetical protein
MLPLGIALWLLGSLLTAPASAAVRRYAVVIGANLGAPEDPALRYAERDARRVAAVLTRFGRVDRRDLVLLTAPDAEAVRQALTRLNRRIENERSAGDETVLLMYYSGHADGAGLHLGGTRLRFRNIYSLLDASPADIRVLLLDACQSGQATRVKGARPDLAFAIEPETGIQGEGLAVITSSAVGEDAQESDELQGSFFTTYLLTGLMGAADISRDGLVTLNEAYRYARAETLRATSLAPLVQHPSYLVRLRGRDDLVLTVLSHQLRDAGRLRLRTPGAYLVLEGNKSGAVAAELQVIEPVELVLPAGRYLLRRRERLAAYETHFEIREGVVTAPLLRAMRRVSYQSLARKGNRPAPASWAMSTAGGVHGGIAPGLGRHWFTAAGIALRHPAVGLELRGAYSRGGGGNDSLEMRQQIFSLDLAALHGSSFGRLGLAGGLRAGGDRVVQTFVPDGRAPRRTSWGWHGAGLLRTALLGRVVDVYLEASIEALFLPGGPEAEPGLGARLVPRLTAGLVLHRM